MGESRKYYEAYDDRYRQVHGEHLRWFGESPTPIVAEVISKFAIAPTAKMLEIGCGEGRDARYLLKQGFDLLATDISGEAVAYCKRNDPEHGAQYKTLNCVTDCLEEKFDFIYAVAVVHMLVEDADRNGFYQFVRNQLAERGIGLICTMGDGTVEMASDVGTAFELQERVHEASGKKVSIAGTSYRAVSFDTFRREMEQNGLEIIGLGLTSGQPDYYQLMYAVVKGK